MHKVLVKYVNHIRLEYAILGCCPDLDQDCSTMNKDEHRVCYLSCSVNNSIFEMGTYYCPFMNREN